jgi:hypothetical protein
MCIVARASNYMRLSFQRWVSAVRLRGSSLSTKPENYFQGQSRIRPRVHIFIRIKDLSHDSKLGQMSTAACDVVPSFFEVVKLW